MTDYTEYVECECGSEIISITKWDNAEPWNDDDPEIFLSFYSIGAGGHRPTWRYRLKYIWQIIRRGHPYTDSIVLSEEEAKGFADKLWRFVRGEFK